MAVISIRKKNLALSPQEPVVPAFDGAALWKELAAVNTNLKEARKENAELKLQISKLSDVPRETQKPTSWDFKVLRNNDGTIKSVTAHATDAKTEAVNPHRILYGD